MKNTFLTAAAIVALAFGANAQTATTEQTTQTTGTQPATTTTVTTATTVQPVAATTAAPRSYGSTVDSIHAKYQYLPMPEAWTAEKTYPVLGTYQLNGAAETAANLTITLDTVSKGIVWISGLPQGTVKAYLAKSPATYRILAQKTAEGKSVPEGTLVYNAESNTLNIALGAPYDAANPSSIFPVVAVADTMAVDASVVSAPSVATVKVKKESGKTKTKSKSKVTFYTASKVNALNTTQSNAAFGQQLDQAAQKQ
ncbi:MAG: hypothetical protein EOO08_13195 [Chitinophagaceae bacterium]|nr:MAG: hypothetical protein EOO08_13195 [Chitinophagaceae bacterium]